MRERAGERGVLEGPGEGPDSRERAVQPDRGDEPGHRTQVDARRCECERLEPETTTAPQAHVARPANAGLRPAGHERVTEGPVRLEGEVTERSRRDRVPREATRDELEIEGAGVEIRVAQRDQPGIGGAQGRDPARHHPATVRQPQRVEPDFEHACPVRAQPHIARHDARAGPLREATIDEREVGERRRVGAQPQIE